MHLFLSQWIIFTINLRFIKQTKISPTFRTKKHDMCFLGSKDKNEYTSKSLKHGDFICHIEKYIYNKYLLLSL